MVTVQTQNPGKFQLCLYCRLGKSLQSSGIRHGILHIVLVEGQRDQKTVENNEGVICMELIRMPKIFTGYNNRRPSGGSTPMSSPGNLELSLEVALPFFDWDTGGAALDTADQHCGDEPSSSCDAQPYPASMLCQDSGRKFGVQFCSASRSFSSPSYNPVVLIANLSSLSGTGGQNLQLGLGGCDMIKDIPKQPEVKEQQKEEPWRLGHEKVGAEAADQGAQRCARNLGMW
ncbi:hypothetical protein BTVI_21397 [Pitangus sulphuratus]|nr:hypothetical protein BTVI_21397 [Pitangus sulphuratus]